MANKPIIKTSSGLGELEKIYISDLGFLMIRIDNMDGSYTTYNFGKHDVENNMFTKEIMKDEKS
jgi:hypothetical protein